MWRELKNVKVFGLNFLNEKKQILLSKFIKDMLWNALFSLIMTFFVFFIFCIAEISLIYLLFVFLFLLLCCFLIFSDGRSYLKEFLMYTKYYNLLNKKINCVEILIIPESNDDDRLEIKVDGVLVTFFDGLEFRKDLEFSVLDLENGKILIADSEKNFFKGV